MKIAGKKQQQQQQQQVQQGQQQQGAQLQLHFSRNIRVFSLAVTKIIRLNIAELIQYTLDRVIHS